MSWLVVVLLVSSSNGAYHALSIRLCENAAIKAHDELVYSNTAYCGRVTVVVVLL